MSENPRLCVVSFRVSDDERRLIDAAARLNGDILGTFAREVLVHASAEKLKTAGHKELNDGAA